MIICADVLEWCKTYTGAPFMGCLCDPPYHLTSITKRFGKEGSAPAKHGKDGAFKRASKGFMGKTWDGGEIAFQPETWIALKQHLLPGAFLFAFAGTKGYHRMACAIEDAGFIIHPVIVYIFGSGFPKATRIDTQIDKQAGVEFEPTPDAGVGFMNPEGSGGYNPTKNRLVRKGANSPGIVFDAGNRSGRFQSEYEKNKPVTEMAKRWEGHRYGGQMLKPAVEMICVAQVPYVGRPIDCITQTGAGALNIEAGRLGSDGSHKREFQPTNKDRTVYSKQSGFMPSNEEGRWPSNVLLSEDVAPLLDAQTGILTSGKPAGIKKATNNIYGKYGTGIPVTGIGDSGGASRFFFQSNWNAEVEERLETTEPFVYKPKASADREKGLEDFEGGTASERKNIHPTVKSLSLTKYLASLLLPPAEYGPRRLLVPFGGVASEAIGAHLAGWEEIVAIEQSEEYCKIGEARMKFWSNNSGLFDQLNAQEEEAVAQQETLDF